MIRKIAAEAFGTALLVFFGAGVATLMFGFGAASGNYAAGIAATAFAFGLVVLALAYAVGPISGCHVNPAVTLAALITGRIEAGEAVGYWLAQFAGGIAGALVLWGVFAESPLYKKSEMGLGANGYGSASIIHLNGGGAFLTEVILTAVFVFVVLTATGKAGYPMMAGLAIGLTLTVVHLIGILLDGTSVNPARSLGPALIVGGTALSQVWLFIVAPLCGAVIAAVLNLAMYPKTKAEAEHLGSA